MSKKTNAYSNYPPGSKEAVEKGCLCPVVDNCRGKGIGNGLFRDSEGNPAYWISQKCPLHGDEEING